MAIQAQLADGRVLEFPDGTEPAVIQQSVKRMLAQEQAAPQPAAPQEAGFFEQMGQLMPDQAQIARERILKPAATITTGVLAEPVAGAAGLGAMVRGAGPEVAEEEIKQTREALTFRPETPEARETLASIGEVLEPVGEKLQQIRKTTGDLAFKVTGSPTVAAIATALPDATIEALGFGVGRRAAQVRTGIERAPQKLPKPGKVKERAVTKSLLESAPEVDQIKDASRAIYKEIDDLNVQTKPQATQMLVNKIVKRAQKENVDEILTPKSARVVEQFKAELDDIGPRSVSDLDRLRKRAQLAAQSTDPADARVGAILVDEIDSFMDDLPQQAFTGPDAQSVKNIGERYKAARSLWGRARRAEVVSEAFDKAARQATGFENGIRNQLRQILNNKKRSRFFTKDELSAMDDVVKGSTDANILKLVGRLGFSEGAATNILGGLAGVHTFGPVSAVAGQISRKFAQKVTEKAAKRVETLVRTGADGRKIATAYLQSVPKAKRSAQELSDLLISSGSEVDDLLRNANKTVKEAAEIARARKVFERAEAAGVAAPLAVQQEQQ